MSHPMVVTVICDGMRPDFVDDGTTPTMAALRRAGTWFPDHRGIFPSATRASSASIATGCYPVSHGLRGNQVALPVPGGHAVHDVGKPEFYDTYRHHHGRLLTRPALAERVAQAGGALLASNVSPGAAYFHDALGHGHLFHRELCYRPGRVPTGETLATPPGAEGDRVMTDRFLTALAALKPAAATLWLSEPDKSMHAAPLGSDTHLAAVRGADALVARVAEAVERLRDEGHDVLFLVGSDHGHEAVTEVIPLERRLAEAGFKKTMDGPELVVAPQGASAFIAFGETSRHQRDEVECWLREQPFIEEIYRGEDLSALGQIPDESLLAVDMAKTAGTNVHGVPGLTAMVVRFSEEEDDVRRDCGMHGGLGPHETNPMLIAVGRGFAAGAVATRRTAIVDIAPTAIRHLDLPVDGFDGTPLQNG